MPIRPFRIEEVWNEDWLALSRGERMGFEGLRGGRGPEGIGREGIVGEGFSEPGHFLLKEVMPQRDGQLAERAAGEAEGGDVF